MARLFIYIIIVGCLYYAYKATVKSTDAKKKKAEADAAMVEGVSASDAGQLEALLRKGEGSIPGGVDAKEAALMLSAQGGDMEMVRRLLEEGDREIEDVDVAEMMAEIPELRKSLEAAGMDPDQPADEEITPLFFAAANDNVPLAEMLLEHDAAGYLREPAIRAAVNNDNERMVELMVNYMDDVSTQYVSSSTLSDLASSTDNEKISELLMEAGDSR